MTATINLSPVTATRPTRSVLIAIGIAVPLAVLLAAPSMAAPRDCGARSDILKSLAEKFHESPVALGVDSNGVLVEVLASDSGATWTILLSRPDGLSCMVATGEEWQVLERIANSEAHAL